MRYSEMWPLLAHWWDEMTIKENRVEEFRKDAIYAIKHKDKYMEVSSATTLPWYMVAVIHWRESSGDFNTYLGNGQPLSMRTTIVPIGRGPFRGPHAFLDGAVDAVKQEGWDKIIDWRLEKVLYYIESFNGWGYGKRPSPYLFGGTTVQLPGKYVRDHVLDPKKWDPQPGAAAILKTISQLDPTVKFVRET